MPVIGLFRIPLHVVGWFGKEAIENLQRIPLDISAPIHTIILMNVGFGRRNIISP